MSTFALSRRAKDDLAATRDYIVKHTDAATADRVLRRFEEAFKLLAEMPYIGHFREDLMRKRTSLYWWPVGSYVVIYRDVYRMDVAIEIVRVLHQARDIPKALGSRAA